MVASGEDVISRVVRLGRERMSPSAAREILSWRFTNADQRRISHLLEKNQEGEITPTEHEELREYVLLGEFIDILQAKAELATKKRKRRQAA